MNPLSSWAQHRHLHGKLGHGGRRVKSVSFGIFGGGGGGDYYTACGGNVSSLCCQFGNAGRTCKRENQMRVAASEE